MVQSRQNTREADGHGDDPVFEEESQPHSSKVAVYARVSSAENKSNLDSQAERLVGYCMAKGYQVSNVVKEVGSGYFGFVSALDATGSGTALSLLLGSAVAGAAAFDAVGAARILASGSGAFGTEGAGAENGVLGTF